MKLKAIERILKGSKRIILLEDGGRQFLSDGYAMYAVDGLPELNEDSVYTIFDIPKKKREKIAVEKRSFPFEIDLQSHGEPLDSSAVELIFKGISMTVFYSAQGAIYIQGKYLKPFENAENGVMLFLHTEQNGEPYISVSEGFFPVGAIMPVNVKKDVQEQLDKLLAATGMARANGLYGKEKEEKDEE